jgi:excisionase family DNA binding protein
MKLAMEQRFSVKELAAYAHLSRQTIYNLVSTKRIPYSRISEKKVVFDKDEIDDWLRKRGDKKREDRGPRINASVPQVAYFKEQTEYKTQARPPRARPPFAPILIVSFLIALGWGGGFFYYRSKIHSIDISDSRQNQIDLASLIREGKIGSIDVRAGAPGREGVQVRLDQITEIEVQGSVMSSSLCPVLIQTLKTEREDYALKSKLMDILGAYVNDPKIRKAMIHVVKNDTDPSLRMKALTVLAKLAWSEDVKEALLDRLKNDETPGIRFKSLEIIETILNEEIIAILKSIEKQEKDEIIKNRVEAILTDHGHKTSQSQQG